MRSALLLAIAACAPGCQLVFPLEEGFDKFPHVPADKEGEPNAIDLVVADDVRFDTSTESVIDVPSGAALEIMRQDGETSDLAVLRLDRLRIQSGGVMAFVGTNPLVIIARRIEIEGTLDASGVDALAGPGGGVADTLHDGRGGDGVFTNNERSATGGGGGAFGLEGGEGGPVDCPINANGGASGEPHGDDRLRVLIGGSAGGHGGLRCVDNTSKPIGGRGGGGGGALQLSATEEIEIGLGGRVVAGGGGGGGGAGNSGVCPLTDGAGGGGGSGGAIYLDAPLIINNGLVAARGGGGGGGGGDGDDGPGSNADGKNGVGGNDEDTPSAGGFGIPAKGTPGGSGGADTNGQSGAQGKCMLGSARRDFNTGGGGGGPGRIVTRGKLDPAGTISPDPVLLGYPAP